MMILSNDDGVTCTLYVALVIKLEFLYTHLEAEFHLGSRCMSFGTRFRVCVVLN